MAVRAAVAARETPSTRDLILDAAERCFAGRGFAGVSVREIAAEAGPWDASELPHVGLGLYHLIFGYFADATLFEVLAQHDPRSPAAVARQRRFVKAAVAQLLGGVRPVPASRRRS